MSAESFMSIANLHVATDGESGDANSPNPPESTKTLHAVINALREELESKNIMLDTAANAGQQLLQENEGLMIKMKALEDDIDSSRKTVEVLQMSATRSSNEADELHGKVIECQQVMQQLREDNSLLTSMQNTSTVSHEFEIHEDTTSANKLIAKLRHEKSTLERFLQEEQDKCLKFLQHAEVNARKLAQEENENQDLSARLAKSEQQHHDLVQSSQQEIEEYLQSLEQLQADNESQHQQLTEQQRIMNSTKPRTSFPSTVRQATMRMSATSGDLDTEDQGLFGDLQDYEYDEPDTPIVRVTSEQTIQSDDDCGDESENESTATTAKAQPKRSSITQSIDAPPKVTVDAEEEFYRLTIIAAKIKYSDVPISTSALWEKVNQADLAFHEIADWLNAYLMAERAKIAEAARLRVQSVTNRQYSGGSPSKKFFQKIKDIMAENVTSTVTLQVRFGRRVFEVKMKRNDQLSTLLQTLPRIIGEEADKMEIFNGRTQLDSTKTLSELGITPDTVLRMIHRKKMVKYLRNYESRRRGAAGTSAINKATSELKS